MFTPLARLLILLVCVGLSSLGAIYGNWLLLFLSTVVSLTVLWGYYRVGTVLLALNKMRRGDYEKAGTLLDAIRNPARLTKNHEASYHFIRGLVAHQADEMTSSKQHLRQALEIGLKREHDRAMALLALTDIEMVAENKQAARTYFAKMKGLKVRPGLMPQIRRMQTWLDP